MGEENKKTITNICPFSCHFGGCLDCETPGCLRYPSIYPYHFTLAKASCPPALSPLPEMQKLASCLENDISYVSRFGKIDGVRKAPQLEPSVWLSGRIQVVGKATTYVIRRLPTQNSREEGGERGMLGEMRATSLGRG